MNNWNRIKGPGLALLCLSATVIANANPISEMQPISHFSIDTGRSGESAHGAERSFKDFSVLYRLTQQSQHLVEALERRGIPSFRVSGLEVDSSLP